MIEIISAIKKIHPKIFYKRNGLTSYLLSSLAMAEIRRYSGDKPSKPLEFLIKMNEFETNTFTSFSRSIFLMALAEYYKKKNDHHQVIKSAKQCIEVCERNNILINQINPLLILIESYHVIGEKNKAGDYQYYLFSLLEDNNISIETLSEHSNYIDFERRYSLIR